MNNFYQDVRRAAEIVDRYETSRQLSGKPNFNDGGLGTRLRCDVTELEKIKSEMERFITLGPPVDRGRIRQWWKRLKATT